MSWVTVAWSLIVAVCLTLGLQHFFVWCRLQKSWADLVFAISALGTASLSAAELLMMRAQTAADFNTALRWSHVPVWVMITALMGFVRLYLHAGRWWLAVSVCVVRALSLFINFLCTPNLNFRPPVHLRFLPFLGESVAIAQGQSNPWMLVGNLSLVLLVGFVIDATLTAGRRGNQRHALVVGGSFVFFVLLGSVQAILALWGLVVMPAVPSLFYLGIGLAMSFKLSEDQLRVGQLGRDLHETELQLGLAAAAARIGLWKWDIEKNSVWMTPQGRALFGFDSSEPLPLLRFLENLHPEDRAPVQRAMQQALKPGGEFEREYRRVMPDGKTRWVSGYGRVECRADGTPLHMRGVSMDITQRIEAGLAVQHHRNEVSYLFRVNLLGVLSGSLAHELNQPLTAILSNAQAAQRFLAQAAPDLDEVRAILHDIVADDQRAGEVIVRLRRLLEKGELQLLPADINEIVAEVLKLLGHDLLQRQVVVQTSLAAKLPLVHGDRVQLQQVLINLIVNGCDAMQENPVGERTLLVSTTLTPAQQVQICVADRGPGVAEDQRETIFQPFFTTKSHGLGLGLSVCRNILAAHQGRLWAEDAAYGGAAFYFSLPPCPDSKDAV